MPSQLAISIDFVENVRTDLNIKSKDDCHGASLGLTQIN